ncbi:MAG: hypothetical protein LBO79_07465 [Zoogloeaceae bacterium]|jgi:hypothetical protein|nr:hypothetical protein [Zoogloeaceae bacterium]
MRTIMKLAAVAATALVVAACGSPKDANKANFSKAIQAYLDTQPAFCVDIPGSKFPLVLVDAFPHKYYKPTLEALVELGLLGTRKTEEELPGGKKLPATEYLATKLGKQYLVTGKSGSAKFCTGKYKLTGIDNFTEPAQNQWVSATMSQAAFQYEITDLAEWTQSAKLRAVYEREFKELEKNQDKAVLILTNEGWIHERLFNDKS